MKNEEKKRKKLSEYILKRNSKIFLSFFLFFYKNKKISFSFPRFFIEKSFSKFFLLHSFFFNFKFFFCEKKYFPYFKKNHCISFNLVKIKANQMVISIAKINIFKRCKVLNEVEKIFSNHLEVKERKKRSNISFLMWK